MRREVTPHAHGRGFGAVRFPDLNAAASRRGANKAGGTNFAEGHLWPNEPIPFRRRVVLRPAWMIVSRRPTPAHGRFCQLWGMLRGLFKKMAARIRYSRHWTCPRSDAMGLASSGPARGSAIPFAGAGDKPSGPRGRFIAWPKKMGWGESNHPNHQAHANVYLPSIFDLEASFYQAPQPSDARAPFRFQGPGNKIYELLPIGYKANPQVLCGARGRGTQRLVIPRLPRETALVGWKAPSPSIHTKTEPTIFFLKYNNSTTKWEGTKKASYGHFRLSGFHVVCSKRGKKIFQNSFSSVSQHPIILFK